MSANVKKIAVELLLHFEEKGFEIWNVEYVREGKERQLRVFIDKEDCMTIDDCEMISRFLSEKLDQNDPVVEPYSLIVSSPGMDRQLMKDEHFERYKGEAVEVSLYKGYEGRKKFAAILGEKTEEALYVTPIDNITLTPESDEIRIPAELISKVNKMVII
jgi:ribosome maturation factor RimP